MSRSHLVFSKTTKIIIIIKYIYKDELEEKIKVKLPESSVK